MQSKVFIIYGCHSSYKSWLFYHIKIPPKKIKTNNLPKSEIFSTRYTLIKAKLNEI